MAFYLRFAGFNRDFGRTYSAADPSDKLETLEALTPPSLRRGRFQAPDKLMALLKKA
jgi:hypothetical protein